MVNIKCFPVSIRGFTTSLTNLIASTRGSSLFSPQWPIVSIISAAKVWMKFAVNILGTPLSIASIVAKQMLRFALAIANVLASNGFATITTRRSPGSSRSTNIPPVQFFSTLTRARTYFMAAVIPKSFAANRASFINKTTAVTVFTISSTLKNAVAVSTKNWVFSFRQKNLSRLRLARKSWGIHTGMNLSTADQAVLARTNYIIVRSKE